ncbi:MAG: hypothetical protein HY819_05600 [Acidobacteria bacterium]|nr:hypothetical protein [Acidobacteriota bacterium]
MKTLAVIYSKKSFFQRLCWIFVIAFSAIIIAGCGRVGPPLPPIKYKALVPEMLQARQRGTNLILTWPKPGVIAMQNSKVSRAEILRRDETTDTPLRLPEEKFLEEARVIATIPSKDISDAEANTLFFTDTLPAGNLNSTLRYRYAIRYTNFSGASLPLSNYVLVEPTTAIAKAPENPATELTQEAIKLTWSAPAANLDETQPANILGYNIYRRSKDGAFSDQPINSGLITSTSFEDKQFKFGNNYFYIIRSVSSGKNASIESPDSKEILVKAKDTFAPIAPSNVTGAAAAGLVSLFWPANTEKDLRGYFIYRAEKKDAPRSEWTKLTPSAIAATTFRDERAQIGKTYVYFITALDLSNNESLPSEGTEVEAVQ